MLTTGPYEGFSANLAGLSPDDEKSILHTFSQEEQDEALRQGSGIQDQSQQH